MELLGIPRGRQFRVQLVDDDRKDTMATTTLLVFAVGAALVVITGVMWILWEDTLTPHRPRDDLKTCEAIWSLTSDR